MGSRFSFDEKQLERFSKNLSDAGFAVERREFEGGRAGFHVEGGWNVLRMFGRGFSMDIVPEYEKGMHVLDFDKKQLPLPDLLVAAHPSFIRNYRLFRNDAIILLAIPVALALILLFGYLGMACSIVLAFLMIIVRVALGSGRTHELDVIRRAAESVK